MNRQTAELVRALSAVTNHIPRLTTELLQGTLQPERQREYAGLLSGLAGLLKIHADDQEQGDIPTPTGAPLEAADRPELEDGEHA